MMSFFDEEGILLVLEVGINVGGVIIFEFFKSVRCCELFFDIYY